ncbi:MAG: hypothetical protein O3C61_03310 [Proteobacteria bacterium]|nr:hypothetical protein [Pseudomonadota bacterium]
MSLSTFLFFIGCGTTTQNTMKIKEISQKVTKNFNLGPEFEIITTFNNKKIDLLLKEYGKFDLTRIDGDLSFQRLDKGFCRVFVQSSILTGNINSILVFHLKKKKFYPQFQLKDCV